MSNNSGNKYKESVEIRNGDKADTQVTYNIKNSPFLENGIRFFYKYS